MQRCHGGESRRGSRIAARCAFCGVCRPDGRFERWRGGTRRLRVPSPVPLCSSLPLALRAPGLWRLLAVAGVVLLAAFLPYRFLREQRRTDRQVAALRRRPHLGRSDRTSTAPRGASNPSSLADWMRHVHRGVARSGREGGPRPTSRAGVGRWNIAHGCTRRSRRGGERVGECPARRRYSRVSSPPGLDEPRRHLHVRDHATRRGGPRSHRCGVRQEPASASPRMDRASSVGPRCSISSPRRTRTTPSHADGVRLGDRAYPAGARWTIGRTSTGCGPSPCCSSSSFHAAPARSARRVHRRRHLLRPVGLPHHPDPSRAPLRARDARTVLRAADQAAASCGAGAARRRRRS